jgi:hypothetical protein
MLDRPTPEVTIELNRAVKKLPAHIEVGFIDAPAPVISGAQGEQWMSTLRILYAFLLENFNAQAAMLWDDDFLFTEQGLTELRGHMQDMQADRYEALSLFFWDKMNTYNAEMVTHWGPILFRCYPGDDFPLNFVVACPEAAARSKYMIRLKHPLLNYGYLNKTDRELAWHSARQSGRVDAFTLNFINESPELKIWQSNVDPRSASKPSKGSRRKALHSK